MKKYACFTPSGKSWNPYVLQPPSMVIFTLMRKYILFKFYFI